VEIPAPPEAADDRPRIQAIVSPEEARRIEEAIKVRKRELNERLGQLQRRQLDPAETNMVGRIQSFISQADEAARRGELAEADALSERALLLARELQLAR
jgi:hypothetical protein